MLAKVLSLQPLSADVFDLRLGIELPNAAPGRFVHVQVPGLFLRRPISICGYRDGELRLVFAVKGEGTRRLSRLRERETADILGPLGNGFPFLDRTDPVLLVGGGIGLPPLLYFAQEYGGTSHTIAGFRNAEAVVLADEFPFIDICTDNGQVGFHCYPHQRAEELLSGKTYSRVLCCGPYLLLKAISQLCETKGIDCFVSMEERMGCGVGACLVCACSVGGRHRHVCKDGPVFSAKEVDWT